jgi:spore coat-associated protein N
MDELLREMITPPPPRRDPARRRRLIGTAAILGMAGLGLTSLVTSAIFTDEDDAGRTGIITGTVDIAAGDDVAFTLPSGNLAPGDSVYSPVTVQNAGSLALVYDVSYVATDRATATGGTVRPLAAEIGLSLYAVDAESSCSAAGVAGRTALTTVTSLSSGEIAADRGLIAGRGETLCVQVSLPEQLATEFQDSATDLQLTFSATQDPTDPHRTGS